MRFINALEQARFHIRTLWLAIILICSMNIAAVIGWMHAQSKVTVYIPPNIPQSGLTTQLGQAPKTTVYSFAFYVWQSLNHWANNGLINYKNQINQMSPYITPQFKARLVQNYNNLLNQGELQDRTRSMQGMSGVTYSPVDVKALGHGVWLVHLKMRLTETINTNAKIVKDVQMLYTLKIIRRNVDANTNHWGLSLAGFAASPVRIKTIV